MKIRNDFVSNSSSSSYIVISSNEKEAIGHQEFEWTTDPVNLPSSEGCCEFGWEFEHYSDFWDKVNWCALLIQEERYANEQHADEMEDLLQSVCANEFHLNVHVMTEKEMEESHCYAYIDHQSGIRECPENARMFNSYYQLFFFLACAGSTIHTGNDNV